MATKKKSATKLKIDITDPDSTRGVQKAVGGSQSDHWNLILAAQAIRTLWTGHSDEEGREQQYKATASALIGMAPKDEIEGMIAAQLLAAHNAAMECYRRAMLKDQSFEGTRENLNQANKLSRTYGLLLDALNRHRGKGQQKVTVEHVHVHSGGQAVVGVVEPPVANNPSKLEDRHAKQIAHAPQPPMRSANAERQTMPVPSNAERPLPNARGQVTGGTEGE